MSESSGFALGVVGLILLLYVGAGFIIGFGALNDVLYYIFLSLLVAISLWLLFKFYQFGLLVTSWAGVKVVGLLGINHIGNPNIFADVWEVQNGNTCAINSQRLILKKLYGINVEEVSLSRIQESYRYFDPIKGATSFTFLLEGYGANFKVVSVSRYAALSLKIIPDSIKRSSLGRELFKLFLLDKLMLVTVNSDLLSMEMLDGFHVDETPKQDHVIILTGIGSKNGVFGVFYSDTGVTDGERKFVPLRKLEKILGEKAAICSRGFVSLRSSELLYRHRGKTMKYDEVYAEK